jgi:diaminopimelate epimerase
LASIGPRIENLSLFPRRVNVEFVEIIGKEEIRVRVWERGVGETLACGTGACASVVAGNMLDILSQQCLVHLLGGDLQVYYNHNHVFMSGPAVRVFKGKIGLEDII